MRRDHGPTISPSESSPEPATTSSGVARPTRSMGGPRRRRLDAADAREAILEAAEALLISSGPDALRLTDIAARAGVSHPNVLYHFGSIGELQRRLAQRVVARLASEIDRSFASEECARLPIDRVIAAAFAVFDQGGYARLLAWLAISQNEPSWDALGASLEVLRGAIAAHPAMRGEDNEERRRRAVTVIELSLASAIGYGLIGHTVERLFPPDPLRPSLMHMLGHMLGAIDEQPGIRGEATPSEE